MEAFTHTVEEAQRMYDFPVQCGECYIFYDLSETDSCPVCGCDDMVGDR